MTSYGSTLTKCPPKTQDYFLAKYSKITRSYHTKDILVSILVRAKPPKRLLHVDGVRAGLPSHCYQLVLFLAGIVFVWLVPEPGARRVDVGICTIRMNSRQNASFQIPYARASSGSPVYNFRLRCPCKGCISGSF